MKPSRQLVWGFGALILTGSAALFAQARWAGPVPISALDALFTATSAVCVTGLTVLDTGSDFGPAGQALILALIQLGGLGILTLSNIVVIGMGRRLDASQRTTSADVMGRIRELPTTAIPLKVMKYTFAIEFLGALLLYPRFSLDVPPAEALWLAVFHAVSAFCNAGFSLFPDSLVRYRGDIWIQVVISGLIVAGGLGFVVFAELSLWVRRVARWRRAMLSLHSRVVLLTTTALILGGGALLTLLEGFSPCTPEQWHTAFLPGVFLAITSRTAGFNTIETGHLANVSLLVVIALMFIGASPGSCGGGIKTSTLAVLASLLAAGAKGRRHAEILRRRIASETVSKSIATTAAMLAFILVGTFLLEMTEHAGPSLPTNRGSFLGHLFEATSAVGTVGLSTGVTPTLSAAGRVIVMILMFAGRVGPLILADSLVGQRRVRGFECATAPVMVG